MKSILRTNICAIMNYLQNVLMILIFFLSICVPDSLTLKLPDSVPVAFSEHTNIKISDVFHSSHRTRRSSSPSLPESLNLQFYINGNPIKFALTRNKHLTQNFPTYISKNGVLEFNHGIEQVNEAFYQDPYHTASVHFECATKFPTAQCHKYKIFASFITQGKHYILHSDWSNTTGSQDLNRCRVVQPSMEYELQNDYVIADTAKVQRNIDGIKHRYKRQVTGNYEVELLMVTDYSVFKYWYDSSTKSTDAEKTADARRSIYVYFAFMLNGIDVRYQNLPGAAYTIKVTYAGLQITESPLDSPWTENFKIANNNPPLVSANFSLYAFGDWVIARGSSLPGHDHAMLFTRYDLHNNFETGTTGYATLGAVCTPRSQSVVEEKFNFISQTVAAHELGHSLNAVHDGDSNSCFRNNYFIMAASSSATTGSIAHHPWEFSSCTTNEIRNYIGSLSRNCMLVKNSTANPSTLDVYLSPMMGQTYTHDQQCEKMSGTGSYLCVDQYTTGNYDTVCTGMWCSSTTQANSCTLYIPADGTTCGNKKWCINGVCTASSAAPAADENCVFGDSRGIAVNSLTCQGMMTSSPYFCYNAGIRSRCCESCKENYNPGNPSCLYGDKADCSVITEGSMCYNVNTDTCCGTCAQYETGIPGCTYGDQARGCVKRDCPVYTANQLSLCCATCYDGTTTARTTTTPTTTSTTTTTPTTTTSTTTTPTTTITTTQPVVVTSGVSVPTDLSTTPPTEVTSTGFVTTTARTDLPGWVIPVAGAVAGIVFIVVIVVVCACMFRNSGSKKPVRGSVRSRTSFTNRGLPYVVPEVNSHTVLHAQPSGGHTVLHAPPPGGHTVLPAPPPGGFSYTSPNYANGHVNQAIPKPGPPKVALKPPTHKRPVVPQRSISVDRGTSVRSAPPNQPRDQIEIVPVKNYLYHDDQKGQPYVNYGYRHDS